MKMKRKLLSAMLVGTMMTSLLAGCSAKETSSETTTTETNTETKVEATTETATDNKEPITITMMNRLPAQVVIEDNPVIDAIEEATGVRLEIDAPPINNYTDRLQLTMASGDLPDIIYTWGMGTDYSKWAQDGLIWDLEDKIQNYPNLMKNISEEQWGAARTSTTGTICAVPRTNGEGKWGVVANTEWLEKLDTEMPTTLDELYAYGEKVVSMDPDGNGKDDTFLMSPVGLWTQCWLIEAFMPFSTANAQSYLPDRDGEYKIKEKMDGYIPYLEYMRKLYAAKMIDPEFFVNQTYDDEQKFLQGRTALVHQQTGFVWGKRSDVSNATEIYDFYAPILGEGQTKPTNTVQPPTWGGWMISADVSEEKLDRILSFLDWANSEEGFVLLAAGVEGIHYTSYDFETRSLIKTTEQSEQSGINLPYMAIANAYEGLTVSFGSSEEGAAYNKAEIEEYDATVESIYAPSVQVPLIKSWSGDNPDLATKKSELEVKFVVGEITLEEFQDFLDNEYFPSIADAEAQYIEVMNAYAASK
jgi:putative aldouronate transport system substrate-binding protein